MTDGERCDECGFVYDDVAVGDIPARLRAIGASFAVPLGRESAARLRAHTIVQTWSALEYACHVRDVLDIQRDRVELMMRDHEPSFAPMGREELVTSRRYNEQDPERVAAEIDRAAGELADVFTSLSDAQLARTGLYNWPVPRLRSGAWMGRHTIHEGEHHRRDLDRVLEAIDRDD